MKKACLIPSIIAVLTASLFSQNIQEEKTNELKRKNALLFSFDGLKLSSFNGGFGWKKWTSNSRAVVGKFKILLSKDKEERTEALSGSESSQISFELTFGVEKHLSTVNRLSPYLGGQIGIGYEESDNKIIPSEALSYYRFNEGYRNESERRLISFSLQIILGIEYYLKKNISLSGQYSFGGYYGFGKEKTVSNIVDGEQDISKIHLGIRSSSLILSIYL